MRWMLLISCLMLVATRPVAAQESDLTVNLSEVGEAYARAYLQPLADVVGADLNAGLFNTAATKRLGFNVYVGVRAAAVMIPGASRTFDLDYAGSVDVQVQAGPLDQTLTLPATFHAEDAPTIFGDSEDPTISYETQYDTTISYLGIQLPVSGEEAGASEAIGGLVNLRMLGSPVLHLRLGSVLGTDLLIRWVPASIVDRGIELAGAQPEEVGSARLFGVGVRHGLNTYLPFLPLDVAVQALWQESTLQDAGEQEVLKATSFAASLQAGKRWGIVSVFGGLQTEATRLKVAYTFEDDDVSIPISFTMTGAQTMRGVIGLGLHLGPVRLHGSASVGRLTTYTASLGLAVD